MATTIWIYQLMSLTTVPVFGTVQDHLKDIAYRMSDGAVPKGTDAASWYEWIKQLIYSVFPLLTGLRELLSIVVDRKRG
jgi:hypothetical protein